MKTLFKNIAILTILLATITSCDDVKDLANIEKDTVLTEYFTVDLEGGSDVSQNENLNISVLTSAIEPYKDKLKKVKIQKITFQIVNYSTNYKADLTAEYEVQFSADGTLFMNESFIASDAYENGTIFEVSDTQGINTLATKLLNNDSVNVLFNAKTSALEGPVYFRVETKFYLEVTVNPL